MLVGCTENIGQRGGSGIDIERLERLSGGYRSMCQPLGEKFEVAFEQKEVQLSLSSDSNLDKLL